MTRPWTFEQVELLADLETPVSAFLKLRSSGARFLLESVERGTTLGRYSLLGLDPLLEIECGSHRAQVRTPDGRVIQSLSPGDPSALLAPFLAPFADAGFDQPGNLLGGAVGYLSYEYIQHIEPRVPVKPEDPGSPLSPGSSCRGPW